MIRPTTIATALVLIGAVASAQGADHREKMRKQMEEISKLMRESERLLLEITRVDRLVARQAKIVDELRKLEQQPPPGSPANAAQERQKKTEDLKKKQAETAQQLNDLFDGQRKRGESTVEQLLQLLRSWPKSQNQNSQSQDPKDKQKQKRQREREKQREKKNRANDPNTPRDKKDLFKKKPTGKKPQDKRQAERQTRLIEAWMARLPPEQLERLHRGDLSFVPSQYQRLVREYTAKRAKREAEEKEKK